MAKFTSLNSWLIPQEGLSCVLVSFYFRGLACLSSLLDFLIPLGGDSSRDLKIVYLFLNMCIALVILFFHMYDALHVHMHITCVVLRELRKGHLIPWNYSYR